MSFGLILGVARLVFILPLLATAQEDKKPDFTPSMNPENIAAYKQPVSAGARKAIEEGIKAFSKKDLDAAAISFNKVLALEPGNITGLVNLGLVEFRLDHREAAETLLRKAVRVDPDSGLAWLTLGIVYYNQNKLDAALAALSQAVLIEPKNPRAHNYLAVTIGGKGWVVGAEQELQKAIELDSSYAEAHFNLAVYYLQRTPPAVELARRHYQKALDLGAAPDPLVEKDLGNVGSRNPN